MSNVELQELCEHINSRNRAAQRAQRDSQTLFQTLYFKDKPMSDPKCIADAVIFSLRDNGFLVYIPQYAIKVQYLIKFSSHLQSVGKILQCFFVLSPCLVGCRTSNTRTTN